MEAVFRSYVLGFLPVTSSPFPMKNSLENGHKSSKHGYYSSGNGRAPSEKIRCFPTGTGRHFLTWKQTNFICSFVDRSIQSKKQCISCELLIFSIRE